MKVKVIRTKEVLEDVTLDEVVEEIMDYIGDFYDDDCVSEDIDDVLDDDKYDQLTPEEIELIKKEVEKRVHKKRDEINNEELLKLTDRNLVIELIENGIDNSYLNPGDIGYFLTAEEILDNILKNVDKLKL